jgi:hypothetical protein
MDEQDKDSLGHKTVKLKFVNNFYQPDAKQYQSSMPHKFPGQPVSDSIVDTATSMYHDIWTHPEDGDQVGYDDLDVDLGVQGDLNDDIFEVKEHGDLDGVIGDLGISNFIHHKVLDLEDESSDVNIDDDHSLSITDLHDKYLARVSSQEQGNAAMEFDDHDHSRKDKKPKSQSQLRKSGQTLEGDLLTAGKL